MTSFSWQGNAFEQQKMIRAFAGKRATRGSVAVTEKREVKPILQMSACSLFLNIVPLFDLKLKRRPCGSTSWFISTLSDRPFMDFLALLRCKIGPFWVSSCCPHTTLDKHSYSANTFCKAVSWRRELLPPDAHTHYSSTFRSCDLHFTYESSTSLWTRICANYSFLWSEHL